MLPTQLERHRRRLERITPFRQRALRLDASFLDALGAVVPFDGICVELLDPLSSVPIATTHWTRAAVEPGSVRAAMRADRADAALHRYARTRRRATHVLSDLTHGDLARSAWYREFLAPRGIHQELRSVLVTRGTKWGVLRLGRERGRRTFSPDDVSLIEALVPHLTGALMRWYFAPTDATAAAVPIPSSGASTPPGAPAVVVLDELQRPRAATPDAHQWFARVRAEFGCADGGGPLPPFVHAVAAAAAAAGTAHARLRLRSGGWLRVEGRALAPVPRSSPEGPPPVPNAAGDDTTDSGAGVAIVLEPERPDVVADILGRLHGLSPRERATAALAVAGRDTLEIARRLEITPYTVQDHLKAIFRKVGVRNRRALGAALGGPAA